MGSVTTSDAGRWWCPATVGTPAGDGADAPPFHAGWRYLAEPEHRLRATSWPPGWTATDVRRVDADIGVSGSIDDVIGDVGSTPMLIPTHCPFEQVLWW